MDAVTSNVHRLPYTDPPGRRAEPGVRHVTVVVLAHHVTQPQWSPSSSWHVRSRRWLQATWEREAKSLKVPVRCSGTQI